ncbi:GNAT family N-acetyltransferase [Nocardioides speluncae]|uniref:GNAT family N-acetyltransferase n=1 Tax=Nocardioides speluncae TaxID=2670337 RepID=UPI000D69C2BD|nr:GNAT family N-acetyltransferase [Nocardioides speluncae]
MEIVEVDPFDDEAFEAWYATQRAADVFGREETATPWHLEEARVAARTPNRGRWHGRYAGIKDGVVVVSGEVETPLLDNLDQAELQVYTHPEHRRQGHGSAMLGHLEAVAADRGRTLFGANSAWPYDAPVDGVGTSGGEFLAARGYKFGLGDVQRMLPLPVADALLDELAADAASHHAAYTLTSWVGQIPDELAQGWTELSASLMTEAPLGEMERDEEIPDVDLARELEEIALQQGRTKYNTVAQDADGEVVAYTDIAVSSHDTGNAFQWGTLVRRDHRGHRLGLAVKVANLKLLQSERDDVRRVITWNAEVNGHMIGVNERLGFRPTERFGEFQKRI